MMWRPLVVLFACHVVLDAEPQTAGAKQQARARGPPVPNLAPAILPFFNGDCAVNRADGFSIPGLGDFHTPVDSPYCSPKCSRAAKCCSPQKPDQIPVRFLFSSNSSIKDIELKEIDTQLVTSATTFLKPVVFIIHGFKTDITDTKKFPKFGQMRDAFLNRGYAVVLVDWSIGSMGSQNQAIANLRIVGAITGRLIYRLGIGYRTSLVGHSLGAQMVGEIGSWLKKRNILIPSCIGLDPAGVCFDGCDDVVRLDKSDCAVVKAIITSQFTTLQSLKELRGIGTKYPVGHCDFFANETPKSMPGCDPKNDYFCSHGLVLDYFLSQVQGKCHFVGRQAECGGGRPCLVNGLGVMGLPPDDSCSQLLPHTDYQFNTTAKSPFCDSVFPYPVVGPA